VVYAVLLLQAINSQYAIDFGRATVYYPGDGNCGEIKANGGRFKHTDDHIAHRTIPLGTVGYLCSTRTKKCTYTVVHDRGPFGAIRPCKGQPDTPKGRFRARKIRWKKRCHWHQVQIKLKKGWRYRGQFDLTKAAARRIGHRAFDKVVFMYEKPRAKLSVVMQ